VAGDVFLCRKKVERQKMASQPVREKAHRHASSRNIVFSTQQDKVEAGRQGL